MWIECGKCVDTRRWGYLFMNAYECAVWLGINDSDVCKCKHMSISACMCVSKCMCKCLSQ